MKSDAFDQRKCISVIIPVYNGEKYIAQAIENILFQSYKNTEVIVIDDQSTDNTQTIAERYLPKIKLVVNGQNKGLPNARNLGVENATGEYIHFMDADDLLSPDFYETMISAAEKSESDVVACSVFYEKKPRKSIWFQKSEVLSATADKIKKTEVAIQGWAWRYLIKKSFWDERNFSFPDLVPMEDKPVMIPMIYYANKVALCPNAVYFYKNRENSILNKKYDPIHEKQSSENRHKAREISQNFMRKNGIKRPNKWLYYLKKYMV